MPTSDVRMNSMRASPTPSDGSSESCSALAGNPTLSLIFVASCVVWSMSIVSIVNGIRPGIDEPDVALGARARDLA